MSIYFPPSHINEIFNSQDFKDTNNSYITYSNAVYNYLGRIGIVVSSAVSTTFQGIVNISGSLTTNGINYFNNSIRCIDFITYQNIGSVVSNTKTNLLNTNTNSLVWTFNISQFYN